METYDLGETVEAVALPDCVNTNYGCLPLESVYIAGVVDCELDASQMRALHSKHRRSPREPT